MNPPQYLRFEQRPNSGLIVGLPVIVIGLALGVMGFFWHSPLVVFSGFATAGLGATAWVGLRDLAKQWAEHRSRNPSSNS